MLAASDVKMRLPLLLAALTLASCVRAGFDQELAGMPSDLATERRSDRTIAGDGSRDGRSLNVADGRGVDGASPLGAFGNVRQVKELNGTSTADEDDDPALTADLSEITFASSRGGVSGDLYRAQWNGVAQLWGKPQEVKELNTTALETRITLNLDGTVICFGRKPSGGVTTGIFTATRPAGVTTWSNVQAVAELNKDGVNNGVLAFASGMLYAIYDSNQNGGDYDLYETSRASVGGKWSPPTAPLRVLNTVKTEDRDPWLNSTGTVIYFSSNRSGGFELYVAHRASRGVDFGAPTLVPGVVNTADGDENDPWLSPDERTIYFSRKPKSGPRLIYTATR